MQSNIILLHSFHERYCLMIPHVIPLDNTLESPAGFLRQFQQNKMLRHILPLPIKYSFSISFLPQQSMLRTEEIFTTALYLCFVADTFQKKKNNNLTCLFYLSCLTTRLSNHKEIMAVMETSLETFHSSSHIISLNKVVIYLLNI